MDRIAPDAENISPPGLHDYIKSLPFLGRVSLNRERLVAGEWTELTLTYEIGGVVLADGAWLKLAFKFYSRGPRPFQAYRPDSLSDRQSSCQTSAKMLTGGGIAARRWTVACRYRCCSTRADASVPPVVLEIMIGAPGPSSAGEVRPPFRCKSRHCLLVVLRQDRLRFQAEAEIH